MKTRKLDPKVWASYLRHHADRTAAAKADVHTLDESLEKMARVWKDPVIDIGYDEADQVFRLKTASLAYEVAAPTSMAAMETDAGDLRGLEVVGGDGMRHVIAFDLPKALM